MYQIIVLTDHYNRRNTMRIERRRLRDINDPFQMPEEQFRAVYRLTRQCASLLIEEMDPHMRKGVRSTFIPIPIRVCAALHFFATGSFQRDIGHDFNAALSRTMISRCVKEVSTVLQNKLMAKWIQFPSIEEYEAIKLRFFEETGFPGIIGAVDCTHVRIKRPVRENESAYLNRKNFHSKNVQLICDYQLKIFGVFARFGGASHDAFIWEGSRINVLLEQRYESNGRNHDSWLLGDSGYPLRPWVMTPFRGACNRDEINYNKIHSKARNPIERLNGNIKSIFRCLQRTLHSSPEDAGRIINAVCVLHNFRKSHGIVDDSIDDIQVNVEEDIALPEESSVFLREATVIRDRIKRSLIN